MNTSRELLRRLAACDESCLREIVSERRAGPGRLDARTRALVRLSALLAADAGTASVCWAVEMALAAGVDDAGLVQVLLSGAGVAGVAQLVAGAPRLALALGLDVEAAEPA